jgi:oligosaccharide repeat unit polymerase
VDPWSAAHGGGLGFSFIAEAYVNFGPFGPLVMMFVFGLLLVRLTSWADCTRNPGRLALAAIVLAFILRLPRDEMTAIIRPIVWYGVLPYLLAILGPKVAQQAVKTRNVRLSQRTGMARP